ncbi:MAG: hypothetical protein GWO20_05985, partial [Candidatus Korarchaeota archaeon]|nr:hypothetical protein [Candidatus Korarchaeota archaeon]NIU82985.1 hypothetical protein [Candidatus Thorarchaeota archaeon]NIW13419.1 hypothetical protein [Candidatus Thorarchaeota archaeon]NIW51518.1 hypothetical protein [Candidatus Korarchaeota archaeon]
MEDKEKKDITKTKKELTQGICPICGKESEGTLVTHYISYVPPKVIFICDRCHTTIHQNNNKLRMFEPLLSRKDLVASEKYTHIDTITFKGKDIPFYTPNSVYPIFNKKSHLIEEKKKIIRTINELKQKKEELEE